ncbi:MAG: ABC transporter substrate-binding protein [Myxococcota bacterium]
MNLRPFLLALALVSPAWAGRVAVVQSDDLEPYTAPVQPFLDALGEPADVYNLGGHRRGAEKLAERLKARPPEVVFALGAKAAWIMHERLPDVPIVYASILSPSRFDIEGRNVAGVSMIAAPERSISQLASFFPELERVIVLRGPSIPNNRILAMEQAAAQVDLELVVERVREPKDVRAALTKVASKGDAVWLQADREVLDRNTYRLVVEETHRARVPLVVETENMVRAGGLFAVVPDPVGVGQKAAYLARGVLNGQKPEGEVVYADEVDLVLNVSTVPAIAVPFEELMLDFVDIIVK